MLLELRDKRLIQQEKVTKQWLSVKKRIGKEETEPPIVFGVEGKKHSWE